MSSREVSSFPSSTFVTPQRAAFSGDRFTDLPTSLKSSTTSPLIPSTGKAMPTSAERDRKGKRGKPIRVLFATDAQPEDGGEVPSVIVVTPAKNVETGDITPSPSPAARNARASSPSLRSQSASLGGYSTSLSAARSPSNLATGRAKGENFGSSPDDVRRRRQREKQVSYGELTKGYGNMIALIEHDPLLKCGGILPLSPPEILWSSKRNYGSKRSWDVRLRKWRRALHMFDSVFIDGVHPEDQRQVILEEQRQQWVSAAFADEPREKRVKLSQEELMAVMNSPNVPTKIPVEENLCCILRDENCYESVRNVVPLSASSLIKGTDISPLEAGIKIHIAPSSAVLQRQMERQNGNSPHAINPNLPYTHSLMPCATSPSPKKPLESDLSSMTPNAQRLLNFNSLVNAQDGADKGNDTRVSGAKLTWSESPAPAKKATKETTSSDICTPAKEETPKTCEKASVRRGSSHATTNKNTSELAPTPPKEPTADKARRRATPDMDRCSHAYPHQQTWEMPPSMVPPSFYPPMAGVAPWCYPTPGGHPVMAPMPGMVYYPPYVYPMGPSPMMPYPPAMMMPHAACPMPYAPMPHPYMYPVPMPAHMAPSHDPRRKTQAPVTATKKNAKTAAAPLVTLLPNTHGSAAREKSSVKSE